MTCQCAVKIASGYENAMLPMKKCRPRWPPINIWVQYFSCIVCYQSQCKTSANWSSAHMVMQWHKKYCDTKMSLTSHPTPPPPPSPEQFCQGVWPGIRPQTHNEKLLLGYPKEGSSICIGPITIPAPPPPPCNPWPNLVRWFGH